MLQRRLQWPVIVNCFDDPEPVPKRLANGGVETVVGDVVETDDLW